MRCCHSFHSNVPLSIRRCVSVIRSGVRVAPMAVLLNTLPVLAEPTQSIEVFTTAGEPVVNVPEGVPVIELDAPARLDAELSHGLPDDIDEAKAEMQSRLQSREWRGKLQQYGDLYTGVARAWMLRVEKVPAVVVDSRYVIYGETDVAAAVAQANGYIEREGIQ